MSITESLATLIDELKQGEPSAELKQRAKAFLADTDATALVATEQQLLDAGLKPEDLRQLCALHTSMKENMSAVLLQSLPVGHVIHTMISEHELILSYLLELQDVNQSIQFMTVLDDTAPVFERLLFLASHLNAAEAHHQREEDVLFPAVAARGLTGPPMVMEMEHKEIRLRKKDLLALSNDLTAMPFKELQRQVNDAAEFLCRVLKDHIFKENNILYPAALKVIPESETWAELKVACDAIGYCCFTPQDAVSA